MSFIQAINLIFPLTHLTKYYRGAALFKMQDIDLVYHNWLENTWIQYKLCASFVRNGVDLWARAAFTV